MKKKSSFVLKVFLVFLLSGFSELLFAQTAELYFQSHRNDTLPTEIKEQIILECKNRNTPFSDLEGFIHYQINDFYDKKNKTGQYAPAPRPQLFAVTPPCVNPGFEMGNFTGWQGFTGACCPISATAPGFVATRHTIVTAGIDPICGISTVAPGGGLYSVRLGNSQAGSQAEKLKQTFSVTSTNNSLIYQYAVILQDPGHLIGDQPRFEIRVYDNTNTNIPCGNYNVVATAGINGFQQILYNGVNLLYKDWSTVGVDLSAFVGSTVTIEFSTGDCALGAHFGYAYIDATCGDFGIVSSFCAGDTVISLTAPSGFDQYSWSTGDTTTSIVIHNPVQGDTISAALLSLSGCTTNLSTILSVLPVPVAVACNDTLLCLNSPIVLHAEGGDYYYWTSLPSGFVSTQQDPYDLPLVSTVYSVIVSNACGSDTELVNVAVLPVPTVDAGTDIQICLHDTAVLNASTAASPYAWQASSSLSCLPCLQPMAVPSGTTTYYFTASSANGCTATDSVSVYVLALPLVDAGADKSVCSADGVVLGLQIATGISYLWSPATNLSNAQIINPFASPLSTTKYTCVVTDQFGCKGSDSVTVFVFPLPDVSAGSDIQICSGESTMLSGAGVGTPSWQQATGLSCYDCFNPTVTITESNDFILNILSSSGCKNSDTAKVQINSNPLAGFDYVLVAGCEGIGSSFVNQSTNGNIHRWSFGDGEQSAEPNPTHIYHSMSGKETSVTLYTSNSNCSDSVTKKISFPEDLFFNKQFNVITPGGDHKNDCFQILLPEAEKYKDCFSMIIYNRWGKNVFQTQDPDECWNGKKNLNGRSESEGVYFYICKIHGEEYHGMLSLFQE